MDSPSAIALDAAVFERLFEITQVDLDEETNRRRLSTTTSNDTVMKRYNFGTSTHPCIGSILDAFHDWQCFVVCLWLL